MPNWMMRLTGGQDPQFGQKEGRHEKRWGDGDPVRYCRRKWWSGSDHEDARITNFQFVKRKTPVVFSAFEPVERHRSDPRRQLSAHNFQNDRVLADLVTFEDGFDASRHDLIRA